MTAQRNPWTEAQLKRLVELYADVPTADLVLELGHPVSSIYRRAAMLGIKKSDAYLSTPNARRLDGIIGTSTRFQKGLVPWNTGTHFTAGGRSAETRFKKGHRGGRALDRYQPIGTERISKDGYLERKINDDMPLQKRWRAVHLIAWELVNGPLPSGRALVFKDRDKTNIVLENLELVTRAELMRRNSYHTNYPKEVAQLIQLRGALNRKINRLAKEQDTHEQ